MGLDLGKGEFVGLTQPDDAGKLKALLAKADEELFTRDVDGWTAFADNVQGRPDPRAVLDAGYSIVSSDNEGFEAEIFFGDDSVTGAYRLREAECPDRVIVRLLFEDEGGT
mgnify:CR=1 FL=1